MKESKGELVRLLLLRDGEQKNLKVQPKLTETTVDRPEYYIPQQGRGGVWVLAQQARWSNPHMTNVMGRYVAQLDPHTAAAPVAIDKKLAEAEKKIDELTDIIKSLKAAKQPMSHTAPCKSVAFAGSFSACGNLHA